MADAVNFGGMLGGLAVQAKSWGYWGLGILGLIGILGVVAYWSYNRSRWNLIVEFKLLRNGLVYSEHGKGRYNASKGVCIIKRPGMNGKKYTIKNFDSTKYLQGLDTLTVIQISSEDFLPVIPQSYYEVIDEETGQIARLIEFRADTSKDNAWAALRRRDLISAYTISNWLKDNAQYFGFALVLLAVFVGFAILWSRIGG